MIYLESSALLSVYLEQQDGERIAPLFRQPAPLVSSWLLLPEVWVSLRRRAAEGGAPADVVEDALARFDEDLAELDLMDDVGAVNDRIREDGRFSRCRTLDAIHVASALWWQESTALPVRMATLDRRVAEVAEAVGLELAIPPRLDFGHPHPQPGPPVGGLPSAPVASLASSPGSLTGPAAAPRPASEG